MCTELESRVIKQPDGCWLWAGSVNPQGYGMLMNPERGHGQARAVGERRTLLAHRWAWTLKHGEIPAGLYICHHCDVPQCVNPAHLFAGTARDNVQDALVKGRRQLPQKQALCKRGHAIETRASGVRICRTCHREHQRRFKLTQRSLKT